MDMINSELMQWGAVEEKYVLALRTETDKQLLTLIRQEKSNGVLEYG